jgi:hypothetical protein
VLTVPLANQRPVVRLTSAPPDTSGRVSYSVRIYWSGFDPDGEVACFLYAIDPPASGDTSWVRTTENSGYFRFSTTRADSASFGQANTATQLHTFVIKAVDAQGLASAPDWRSFNAYTVAPQVRIISPVTREVYFPRVPPSVLITWDGVDPDGPPPHRPTKYKYHLVPREEFGELTNLARLNRLAPAFAGWDSVCGDTMWAFIENLVPDHQYVFVVTALDEAGAWEPVFNLNTNVAVLRVSYTQALAPVLTLFNEYFHYAYPSGGYVVDESHVIPVQVPAGSRIRVNWSATPREGAVMWRYRWALDIPDLADETPRNDEALDVTHWSRWSLNNTSAWVGPFTPPPGTVEPHRFYLEAEDNTSVKSLGIVELTPIPFTQERPLLIVDDRRGEPDRYVSFWQVGPPVGAWPTEAELDTFFFARGGCPWKGYGPENGLPAQLPSPPGIFLGYPYDTCDTRGMLDASFPLAILAHYRHLIWYTDALSAEMVDPPTHFYSPITMLRQMTGPGGANSLTVFTQKGGKLLLFGGGTVVATMRAWGDRDTYFPAGPESSLAPGRFPFETLHMRAGMQQAQVGFVNVSARRPPAFAGLVPLLARSGSDPLPPFRTSVPRYAWAELVVRPLRVIEDLDPDPTREDLASTLDTLYESTGGGASGPCGFYYHGQDNAPVVYLGFDLWTWRRDRVIQTVDVFLQQLWGLTREPLPR